ncbi:putative amino acid aldolase or racemase [Mycolicibacterium chubuense NBB4]|uniref:Putative amino acid aldolase or racemase n=1 Tax=Mycolicibacterium chubuense (strain NBB4) TaxID=710421 RepID=I4BQ55_MYCCN|nr:alanine racemase [Mycolicibacterium chubuense]AFM19412.1 putative amino acid aldolase or racemase [Mycolicibacterium chubuense NBB4]
MDTPAHPPVDLAALRALSEQPLDWSARAIPPQWWGRTPAQVVAEAPRLFEAGVWGPVCVLRADALAHNLATMARWCREHRVELAPHGKTHMSPQLAARQLEAGASAITVANVAQAAVYRAFGVHDLVLANELVDPAGLRWVAAELERDAALNFVCWVDSVRGVELMTSALADARRRVPVCVEVGVPGGRTGCRSREDVDDVARAAAESPRLRLVGVAGYEAARGQDVTADSLAIVTGHVAALRAAVLRLAPLIENDDVIVSAGGSTYFDAVADGLTGWAAGVAVRTILRSGCYLTHDHGLYARTSPLTRDGGDGLHPALELHAQVISRPEPGLAIVAMGRRDVSFDQGLPVPLDLPGATVTALNDQHAYLRLGGDPVEVGAWLRFGISHPCTVFDKWRVIPVLDAGDRVVDLVRTYF